MIRMTDRQKNKYFRDFILWKQEGLDIEKQHCLFINFGVNMKFEYPQIRKAIVILFKEIYLIFFDKPVPSSIFS